MVGFDVVVVPTAVGAVVVVAVAFLLLLFLSDAVVIPQLTKLIQVVEL